MGPCCYFEFSLLELDRPDHMYSVWLSVYMGCASHRHRNGPNVCIGGEVYKRDKIYYLLHV